MDGTAIALFAAFAALAVVLGVVAARAERQRREAMAALAAERGWTVREGKDRAFERRFPEFAVLRRGDDRHAERIIEGVHEGRPFTGFDYHYSTTTGSGKDRHTHHHHFSGVIVETELALAPLAVRDENLFDRIGDFFGGGDVDMEWQAFNDEFHVACEDRRFAVDVFQPATMEFLMAAPRFQLAMGGRRVLAFRTRRFEPADFAAALDVVHGVLERLPPSFVVERSLA